MRNRKGLALVAVALIAMAAVAAPALAGEVRVRDFVQQLAKHKNLVATDPDVAASSLRAAGIILPAVDMDKPLTEFDVTAISRSAGLLVTTSNPEAYFGDDKVDRFFQSFSVELARGSTGAFRTTGCDPTIEDCENPGHGDGPGAGEGHGPPFDPFSKGRGQQQGKGKGSRRTPTDPQ